MKDICLWFCDSFPDFWTAVFLFKYGVLMIIGTTKLVELIWSTCTVVKTSNVVSQIMRHTPQAHSKRYERESVANDAFSHHHSCTARLQHNKATHVIRHNYLKANSSIVHESHTWTTGKVMCTRADVFSISRSAHCEHFYNTEAWVARTLLDAKLDTDWITWNMIGLAILWIMMDIIVWFWI